MVRFVMAVTFLLYLILTTSGFAQTPPGRSEQCREEFEYALLVCTEGREFCMDHAFSPWSCDALRAICVKEAEEDLNNCLSRANDFYRPKEARVIEGGLNPHR